MATVLKSVTMATVLKSVTMATVLKSVTMAIVLKSVNKQNSTQEVSLTFFLLLVSSSCNNLGFSVVTGSSPVFTSTRGKMNVTFSSALVCR